MKTGFLQAKKSFNWYATMFLMLFLSNVDPLNPTDKRNKISNPYYNSKMSNPHKPKKD